MDEESPHPCALPEGEKGAQQQIWIGTWLEAKREGGICSNSIGMEPVGFNPSRQRDWEKHEEGICSSPISIEGVGFHPIRQLGFQGTALRHEGSHSRTTLRVGVAIHLDL